MLLRPTIFAQYQHDHSGRQRIGELLHPKKKRRKRKESEPWGESHLSWEEDKHVAKGKKGIFTLAKKLQNDNTIINQNKTITRTQE